jgi:hypothetical protein
MKIEPGSADGPDLQMQMAQALPVKPVFMVASQFIGQLTVIFFWCFH